MSDNVYEFKSTVKQVDNSINISKVVEDVKTYAEGKDRDELFYPFRKTLSKLNTEYFSPTYIKGFLNCPANYFVNSFYPRKAFAATYFGNFIHDIFEDFMNLPNEDRDYGRLIQIKNDKIKTVPDDINFNFVKLDRNVDNFFYSNDYLTGEQINHKSIVCETEKFIKEQINSFCIDLPTAYCLVDRIDIRDGKIYVIDYKTGSQPFATKEIIDKYVLQMTVYKWAVERYFEQEVAACYIMYINSYDNNRYVRVNTESLVNQSIVTENILKYVEEANKAIETNLFPEHVMEYCGSCPIKSVCNAYNNSNNSNNNSEITIDAKIDVNTGEVV